MTNAELIDLFRNVERANHPVCNGCPMKYTCDKNQITRCLFGVAADALDAAEKRIATYQSDVADFEQREKELNDVLNERARLITELQARIAELEAQLPKDGEWRRNDELDKCGGYVFVRWYCTQCGYIADRGWAYKVGDRKPIYKYCPNCGARMDGEEMKQCESD